MNDSLHFLLNLALILLFTKTFGVLSKRFALPQVVGSLLAGVLLGPLVLGWVSKTPFLTSIAELGVIILMFGAGMETDVQEMKRSGLIAFLVALIGVLVPVGLGTLLVLLYPPVADGVSMFKAVFIGVILSATSVSITVETLREMGKMQTRTGSVIMSAAIIDDVLGIIALTLVSSFATPAEGEAAVGIGTVLLKIAAFFVCAGGVGFLFCKAYSWWIKRSDRDLRRFVIVAFVFALLLSYCADRFFGVADVTGAYLAGLIIALTPAREYVSKRVDTAGYLVFTPVFFASIGLGVTSLNLTPRLAVFTVALIAVAMASKLIGCGLTAKCLLKDASWKEAVQVGVGMIARGEVALIVANRGVALGIISDAVFTPIVLLIIATSMLTPVFLKLAYKETPARTAGQAQSKG